MPLPDPPYELMEHTADAQFRAFGETVDEAFGNAVMAMCAIVADPKTVDRDREVEIEVRAIDRKRLLFDFLEHLVFLLDTEKFLAAEAAEVVIEHKLGLYHLRARVLGSDVRKHGANIKAVTYSDMLVEERPDGTWLVQAVIDI